MVTGASTGIGYFLAEECAKNGYDLVIAADEPRINEAASRLRAQGVDVSAVEADLATTEGVDKLYASAEARPVHIEDRGKAPFGFAVARGPPTRPSKSKFEVKRAIPAFHDRFMSKLASALVAIARWS